MTTELGRDAMKRVELFSVYDEGSDKAGSMNVKGYAEDFLRQLHEAHAHA